MLHAVDDATRGKRQLTDNPMIRVAGPFTVEGLSPHRTLAVDWDDELIATYEAAERKRRAAEAPEDFNDFAQMILENLKTEVVQQAFDDGIAQAEPRVFRDCAAGSADVASILAQKVICSVRLGPTSNSPAC